eukprot:m.79625 g.79625  ORF g.79625 m.79625 type:complete len:158 (-) comp19310_c0_seq2:1503-1976(-)
MASLTAVRPDGTTCSTSTRTQASQGPVTSVASCASSASSSAAPGAACAATESAEIRIAYCTDVEGNLDFFHRVIDLSPVLAYVDVDGGPGRDSPDAEISLERDTDYFVFGGDAVYVKDLSSFFFCFGCWTCRPFLPWCSLLNPLRATVLCLWSRKKT